VVATVRNYSTSLQTRTLTLQVGEKTLSRAVELPPLQVRRVAFTVEPGASVEGVLRLSPDAYEPDDSYVLWLGAIPPVDVLAVAPLEEEPAKAASLFFLKKALAATDDFTTVSFRVREADPTSFFALDLSSVRAVFLLGAAGRLREAGFKSLRSYLDRGGTVIATPGKLAAHGCRDFRKYGLFAGRFLGLVGTHDRDAGSHGLTWVNPKGTLGRIFERPEETDLFRFPIRRYVRYQPGSAAVVLLTIDERDPALIEQAVGSGRLFLFALGFDPAWSDLPMTSVFLPMLRELLAAAVPSGYGVRRLACGAPLPRLTDLLGNEAAAPDTDPASTATPGVFRIGDWPVEVNVSRDESLGLKVNLYDLRRALQGASARPRPDGESLTTAGATTPDRRVVELWRYFAGGLALLVLAESLLTLAGDRRELAPRKT
jgi:hypothetical protein